MIVIRAPQWSAFIENGRLAFEADMLLHLRQFFPVDYALLGEKALLEVVRQGMHEALRYSFTEQGQVCRYIDLTLALGTHFPEDPLLPWAASCIGDGIEPRSGFERLHQEALSHIEVVSGAEGHYAVRALLKARALSLAEATNENAVDEEATWRLLRHLWPQKSRRLRPPDRARFIKTTDRLAVKAGLRTPGARQLYRIFCFLLGIDFASNPAMPWAAAALGGGAEEGAGGRAAALYEAGTAALDRLLSHLSLPAQA